MKRRRTFDVGGALAGNDPPEEPNALVLLPAAKHHPLSLPPDVAQRLGPDYESAGKAHQERGAESTREGYARDWAKFETWCLERRVSPLPAHPEVVATYLTWLSETAWNEHNNRLGYKPATLRRARASIAVQHNKAGVPSPCRDERVASVVKAAKKKKGGSQRRARPLMPDHMRAIFKWLDSKGKPLRAARDRALLAVGWAGGLRREELVALRSQDVRIHDGYVNIFIERSKTDQEAEGETVTYESAQETGEDACPMSVLGAWRGVLTQHGADDDSPFIRRVVKEVLVLEPVSVKKVDRLVRAGAKAIGLDPTKYSSHSLRAGIATWFIHAIRKVPYDVKKHMRHGSVAMLDIYVREWDEVKK